MILLGNKKINLTSLGMGRRARLFKLCLKHSTQNRINDPHTWGRLKLKPQGQAIPRVSIYMEWKTPGSYSTRSPFLAHSRFHLSITVFFSDEPRSECHFRTILHAATISYSALPWRPRGLRANLRSQHCAHNSYSYNLGDKSWRHHSSSQVMDK